MVTLLLGDCLEKMKGMADKSVDLIICDLPFGCLATGGGKQDPNVKPSEGRKIVNLPCSWDIKINLELFWKEIKRIRKNNHTPCLMFTTTKYGYELIKSNEKEYRYDLVWDKGRGVSFLSANKMPMRSHEMIYVFSKAGAKYNRIDIQGDYPATKRGGGGKGSNVYGIKENYIIHKRTTNPTERCALSIITNQTKAIKGKHPTEKPLDLYKFLIERYSDVGDTVLDPTFGSCNSGLASFVLKRNYVGIEKDNNFYWKAVNKII